MHRYDRLGFPPMTKKVQVVGAPPMVQRPPATQESDSEAEAPHESEHIVGTATTKSMATTIWTS